MPTRKGWALVVSSVLVGAAGRLLGLVELFLVATGGVALVGAAVVAVRVRRTTLEAGRRLAPGRVAAGGSCRVVLTVANRGRLASPPLSADDGGPAPVLLAPADPGAVAEAAYRLDAPRRGLVAVGPLRATLGDPFGLASRSLHLLASSTLVVHPAVEAVALPPDAPGAFAAARPAPAPVPGGEFHGLRPYEAGDDVRLVHWPTSARLEALVVRQDEEPRMRRVVVAVDLRRGVHDAASVEQAVSAAAGVAAAACAGDGVVRLVTTAGVDSGTAGGDGHLEEVLDLLAAVGPDRAPGLGPVASLLAGEQGATLVVVTTGAAVAAGLGALAGPVDDAATSVVVVLDAAAGGLPARVPAFDRVVAVAPGRSWREAWERVAGREAVGR